LGKAKGQLKRFRIGKMGWDCMTEEDNEALYYKWDDFEIRIG